MSTVQPNYLFLNAPAAADVTLANRVLTLGQSPNSISLNVQKVKSLIKVEGTASVNQVVTVTVPTPVVGNNYAFQVTQQNAMGEYVSYYVSYQALTTVVADVRDALKSVVDALISSGSLSATTSTGASTLLITGTAANPILTGEAIEGITSVTVTTPGNEAFGQGADLITSGIIGVSAQPVSGTSYDALFIEYGVGVEPENTIDRDQAASLVVYYNEAAGAGLTAFLAALNAAIANATANAELINLSDTIA
jgi:hypothetical protein